MLTATVIMHTMQLHFNVFFFMERKCGKKFKILFNNTVICFFLC